MSIKYEVVGRLRVGATRAGLTLSLQKWGTDALAPPWCADRRYAGQGSAPFRDYDTFVGQVL
jgi:hypothetical protein